MKTHRIYSFIVSVFMLSFMVLATQAPIDDNMFYLCSFFVILLIIDVGWHVILYADADETEEKQRYLDTEEVNAKRDRVAKEFKEK